jgi:uncharacterized membrane-anchored protein YitT (DUF2179 family)
MKGKKRRREENSRKGKWMGWADVLIGSAIIAVAFNVFFLPNEIAAGGVSGISTILNGLFRWEPAYVQWALNIPLFLAGVVVLGVRFGVKTLVGTLFLPFAVYLTRDWGPWTDNPLLAAVFGGIGVGLGLGIVFRGNASTGGTDLAAQILAKYTGLSLGNCVALIDGLIEKGLLALIGLYITSKTIDAVQVGFSRSKMAIIITDKAEAVKEKILHNLDRGLTILKAYGGFTEEERNILLVVFDQTEFTNLKQMVKTVDTSAFVVVLDASEVLGKGFKTV